MRNAMTGLAAVFLLLVNLPTMTTADSWDESPNTALYYIPAGTTEYVQGEVVAPVIFVEGTLLFDATTALRLVADRIYLAPGSRVAMQANPEVLDGADVELEALQAAYLGGELLAGNGADGKAMATEIGQDGGDGGDVIVRAPSIVIYETALIGPGSGGKGGEVAIDAPSAPAQGGHGGNAGNVIFDGTPQLPANGHVLRPASGGIGGSATITNSSGEALAIGGNGGDGGFFGTTDATFLYSSPEGYTTFPASSQARIACGTDAACYLMTVAELIGIEDDQNGCGDGADGAPATGSGGPGGNGGDGADGTSGNPTGSPGGKGGEGSTGEAGGATGGDGGDGRCWFSNGGDGGDGTGNGGTGGNGGKGGDGGSGTISGGPGGNGGVCGAGGAGVGVGGQGGQGGTFGSPGKPGEGKTNVGAAGVGGPGGAGGAGLFPGPAGAGGGCGAVI